MPHRRTTTNPVSIVPANTDSARPLGCDAGLSVIRDRDVGLSVILRTGTTYVPVRIAKQF
jgi:hypothetical protein